jgi:hypothetical protein
MDDLAVTVKREVFRYAMPLFNSQTFLSLDDTRQVYVVLSVIDSTSPDGVVPVVMARIIGDVVVIEADNANKPLLDALLQAGVPREAIILAYEGEPIPVRMFPEPHGYMALKELYNVQFNISINLGASVISAVQDGDVMWKRHLIFGVNDLIRALVNYLRFKHDLLIGEPTAEKILIEIGSVIPLPEERIYTVKGRNLLHGKPAAVEISSREVRDVIELEVSGFIRQIQYVLQGPEAKPFIIDGQNINPIDYNLPPALKLRLTDNPIILTGNFRYLRGLHRRLEETLGLKVILEQPHP